MLVVDEAYADFADDSAVRLVTEHDNLVVLRTLSKSYSLRHGLHLFDRGGMSLACPA